MLVSSFLSLDDPAMPNEIVAPLALFLDQYAHAKLEKNACLMVQMSSGTCLGPAYISSMSTP